MKGRNTYDVSIHVDPCRHSARQRCKQPSWTALRTP